MLQRPSIGNTIDLPFCWQAQLQDFFSQQSARNLKDFLRQEHASGAIVYPSKEHIFRAFKQTPFASVRVVLLGQDPYHQPNQAEGLCFSVPDNVPRPPSLRNIFQELSDDLGISIPTTNSLLPWAQQGVLLLNTCLTVRHNQAHSHSGQGWEQMTDLVIKKLSQERDGLVFVLWGRPAREKKALINIERHFVIESAHPSPLSAYRGFFQSRPFSQILNYLKKKNQSLEFSLP